MRQDDRPYLEIRITLVHIIVMIVAVVLLGFLLTYLGYKAGKAAGTLQSKDAPPQTYKHQTEELNLPTDTQVSKVSEGLNQNLTPTTSQLAGESDEKHPTTIEEELRLHNTSNLPPPSSQTEPKPNEAISPKPLDNSYYFTIQVGAFGSFQNAKSYANHFNEMGYKTEIVSSEGANGTLYRVWVGQYSDRDQAMREKGKLELREKKKFSLASNR